MRQEFELDLRNFLDYKPKAKATESVTKLKNEAKEHGEAVATVLLGANGNGKANGVTVAVEHVGEDEDVKVEGH